MKKKSNIHIKKSKQGTFTKAAKKRGMSVQGFARLVLANKDKYSSEMVKKANFAHNSTKWKHKDGGSIENKPVRAPKGYHWMKDKESYNLMAHKGNFVPHTNARREVKFPIQTKHQLGGKISSLNVFQQDFDPYTPDIKEKQTFPAYVNLKEDRKLDPFSRIGINEAKKITEEYIAAGKEPPKFVCDASGCSQIASNAAEGMGAAPTRANAWDFGNVNNVYWQNEAYVDALNKKETNKGNEPLPDSKTNYKTPDSFIKWMEDKNGNYFVGLNRKNTSSSRQYSNQKNYPNNRGYEHLGYMIDNKNLLHGTGGDENHPAYYVIDDVTDGVSLGGYGKYEPVEGMAPGSLNTGINKTKNIVKNTADSVSKTYQENVKPMLRNIKNTFNDFFHLQSGGDISFPNANSYQQVGTLQHSTIPSTSIRREGRPISTTPNNTLFQSGGDIDSGNVATTENEYKNGLNDGINIFKFPRKGLKKMTMTPNSGPIEYPVEYKGYTDGKQTDQGIAQPGQDFNVNGDTVVEIPDLSDMEFNEAFDYANRNKLPIFKWKDNDYPIKKNKKYSKMQDGGLFSNKVTNNVKLDPGFKPDININ